MCGSEALPCTVEIPRRFNEGWYAERRIAKASWAEVVSFRLQDDPRADREASVEEVVIGHVVTKNNSKGTSSSPRERYRAACSEKTLLTPS